MALKSMYSWLTCFSNNDIVRAIIVEAQCLCSALAVLLAATVTCGARTTGVHTHVALYYQCCACYCNCTSKQCVTDNYDAVSCFLSTYRFKLPPSNSA
jgi:hypothetical protein